MHNMFITRQKKVIVDKRFYSCDKQDLLLYDKLRSKIAVSELCLEEKRVK